MFEDVENKLQVLEAIKQSTNMQVLEDGNEAMLVIQVGLQLFNAGRISGREKIDIVKKILNK